MDVWQELESSRSLLGRDRALTLAWLRALEASPSRSTLREEVEASLALADPLVRVAACAALNASAARTPLDAPPISDGDAARVVELTETIDAGDELAAYCWINRANALRALGPESDGAALEAYARALEIEDKGSWHFDLGVCHKWRGRWQDCFDSMLRARARIGDTRAVLWNLGIAGTASGQGDLAAGMWRDLGLPVELNATSKLPVVEGIPPVLVRAPSTPSGRGFREVAGVGAAGFEAVEVQPISPCHGVVSTPSFEETPIDYGDIVVWDGAPVAPGCFPLLEILRRGDEHRHHFVGIVEPGEIETLVAALDCDARVFVHVQGEPVEGARLVYGKLVAPAAVDGRVLADRWERALAEVRSVRIAMPELYESLDTRRAGQEHQAWRGVERVAIKRGLVDAERIDSPLDVDESQGPAT